MARIEDLQPREGHIWGEEPLRIIKNELGRRDPEDLIQGRKPLVHFMIGGDSGDFYGFGSALYRHLSVHGLNPLPSIIYRLGEADLTTRGDEAFEDVYKSITNRAHTPSRRAVQIVRVPDISGCFADEATEYGKSTHNFLQAPLNEDAGRGTASVARILGANSDLPTVILIMHLGHKAGERAYEEGFIDIRNCQFRNGIWVADRK